MYLQAKRENSGADWTVGSQKQWSQVMLSP